MVFIFPSRAGGSWQVFTQTLDSAQKGGQYSHCLLAIGSIVVTWPAETGWSVGTPPPIASAVPSLSAHFRLFTHVCEVFCWSDPVWLSVYQPGDRGLLQLCFGSFPSPRPVSASGVWPLRLRIYTWEWTITADALATGWAGLLPGSNYSRRLLEVGGLLGQKWQFRQLFNSFGCLVFEWICHFSRIERNTD